MISNSQSAVSTKFGSTSYGPSESFFETSSKGRNKIRRSGGGGGSNSAIAKIIILFLLFAILVYNSTVANWASVILIVTSTSTSEKTSLSIASTIGWIAIISTVLIFIFAWMSTKDRFMEVIGDYLLYIVIGVMIIIVIQGSLLLYTRSAVNGTTVQLSQNGQKNLLVAGILSIVVDIVILIIALIAGFNVFDK